MRVGLDRVEDEADALRELIEERLMGRAEGGERGELDHGAHRALEQDRQDDDVEGARLSEPRVDPHVVLGNLGEQDPVLLLGALADEAFAEPERGGEALSLLVAVAGLELQHGVAPVRRPVIE